MCGIKHTHIQAYEATNGAAVFASGTRFPALKTTQSGDGRVPAQASVHATSPSPLLAHKHRLLVLPETAYYGCVLVFFLAYNGNPGPTTLRRGSAGK